MKHKLLVALVFLLALAIMPSQAFALVNTTSPNVLFEDFNTGTVKKPDQGLPWDYWYKTLISNDELGFYKQENLQSNIQCNNDACVTTEDEDDVHFERLALYPNEFLGINIAQLSEQRDAYAYGVPHRWFPTYGHPVTYTTRMRFSPNFHADGTGGAVGTIVTQLWNAPDDYTDPENDHSRDDSTFFTHYEDFYTMGFSWTDEFSVGGFIRGLNIIVADGSPAPAYLVPLHNVDINNWFDAKIVWAADLLGNQTATFYINDQQVGFTALAVPMPSLELLMIHDNERAQFGPGGLVFTPINPPTPQFWEIDNVGVSQY